MPLLAGWNADEIRSSVTLGAVQADRGQLHRADPEALRPAADALLKVYAPTTDADAIEVAAALASNPSSGTRPGNGFEYTATTKVPSTGSRSIARSPSPPGTKVNGVVATSADIGARHAGEIEYVFGQLDTVEKVVWQEEDRSWRTR